MSRLIIIALLSLSSAVFASTDQELKKVLACESTLATLGADRLELLEELKGILSKYELYQMMMPDLTKSVAANAFYADLMWAATQILNKGSISEIKMVLIKLDMTLAFALNPSNSDEQGIPRGSRSTPIPNKGRMETRNFGDDWSDLTPRSPPAPRPTTPPPAPRATPGDFGQPWDMPTGPQDFNPRN